VIDDTGIVVAFWVLAITTIVCALMVAWVKELIQAVVFLALTFVGVAGIYILLSVEFLALVQILIYAGAVTVLLVFALMLTRVEDLKERFDGEQKPLGAIAALALLGAFIAMWSQTEWPRDVDQITVVPFATISDALFGRWAVPFEVASGVLLVALVGAIIIAMREEGEEA